MIVISLLIHNEIFIKRDLSWFANIYGGEEGIKIVMSNGGDRQIVKSFINQIPNLYHSEEMDYSLPIIRDCLSKLLKHNYIEVQYKETFKHNLFPNIQPSKWLRERLFVETMQSMGMNNELINGLTDEMINSNFVYDHVGGLGSNSPKRGVYVIGNRAGNVLINETNWTSSQNTSNVTLVSQTKSYTKHYNDIVPYLQLYLSKTFREAPISDSTFSLAVVNKYVEGLSHNIAAHTDDQPWYATPPVFCSVTIFPNGETPKDYRSTYRFQVKDEGYDEPKWVDVFLPHQSVCMMRADISHRVNKPLKLAKPHYGRINATFRNLVSHVSDPLGFCLSIANHYRYYGLPLKLLIPSDIKFKDYLLERYRELNPEIEQIVKDHDSTEMKSKKDKLRREVRRWYRENNLKLNDKMISKTNVVIETLEQSLELINNL